MADIEVGDIVSVRWLRQSGVLAYLQQLGNRVVVIQNGKIKEPLAVLMSFKLYMALQESLLESGIYDPA